MKSILIVLLILPVALSVLFACGFDLQAEQKTEKGEEVALGTQATVIEPTKTKTVVAAAIASKPVVSTHVKHSIIGPGDKQTVYVHVTDQEGRGLANMVVNLTVQGTGISQKVCVQSTDALGHSTCTFVVPNLAAGSPVFVDASVTWQGQQIKARTSYITW